MDVQKRSGGRPSKYTPEAVNKICRALAQGESRRLACAAGGISEDAFAAWLGKYADFAVAVKRAEQEYIDWEHNELLTSAKKSLRQLIEGMEYDETVTEYENDGRGQPRIKKQTTKTKKILPNATAVIFALCNRDPEHWKNRISSEVEGKIQTEAKQDVNLTNIPDELLEQVVKYINGEA